MIKHLYDELAKRWYHGGTIYVFSDPHFGDLESHAFRGEEYPGDEEVVKRINSKVNKNDTIIFLGDIGDLSYIKKIRGYKVLIMGNHDKGASNYKRKVEYILDEEHGSLQYDLMNKLVKIDNHLFDEVYEGPLMINDKVILSHEPIFPTIPFLFNVHGHVHNKNYQGDEHHLNVCAETINYTPINLINFIKCGNISHIESIHRMTIDGAIKRKGKK